MSKKGALKERFAKGVLNSYRSFLSFSSIFFT